MNFRTFLSSSLLTSHFLLLTFLFALRSPLSAQTALFQPWNAPEYAAADAGRSAAYLSNDEKEVIRLVNLVRMNGPLFAATYLKAYTDSTGKQNKWTRSLNSTLKKLKPLPPLESAADLSEEALSHARDLGEKGKVGHATSSGKGPKVRFRKLVKVYSTVGENCDYGNTTPLDMVMSLLIDENISNLGHRKNILSKKFFFIGVSIHPHKKFGLSCVMDFGGRRLK